VLVHEVGRFSYALTVRRRTSSSSRVMPSPGPSGTRRKPWVRREGRRQQRPKRLLLVTGYSMSRSPGSVDTNWSVAANKTSVEKQWGSRRHLALYSRTMPRIAPTGHAAAATQVRLQDTDPGLDELAKGTSVGVRLAAGDAHRDAGCETFVGEYVVRLEGLLRTRRCCRARRAGKTPGPIARSRPYRRRS